MVDLSRIDIYQANTLVALVCRDVFDGAVFLGLARSRHMDQVMSFIGESWKVLGRPARLQLDTGREFVGWGHPRQRGRG